MSAEKESDDDDDDEDSGGMSPSVVETATGLTPYRILNDAYLEEAGDEEGADSGDDRVPEQPGSLRDAFARTFVDLGAREAVVDGHSDVVNFKADYPTYRRIAQYMSDFEHSRDVIVYDTWVYEVALQKGQDIGINWSSLTTKDGVELQFGAINSTSASAGTSAPAPAPGSGSSDDGEGGGGEPTLSDVAQAIGASAGLADGLALGVVGEAGTSVIAGLLSFLESHGTTRALAKPTISLSSGRHSLYHVGETLEYISKVEVNSSEGDDGDDESNTGVDTEQIETGVKMILGGSYTNGVVSSKLFMDLVELIRFNTFDTGSVKLQLPQTSQRRLHTEFEARPGDLIVIGGLIRDTGDTSQTLIPGTEAALGNASAHKRTELVIMMRPRLIKIRPENWTENDRVGGRVDQDPGAVLDAVKRGAKQTDVIPKDLLLESLRDGETSR
jgi:type II secretory pathway component GspD/PulD (secretin)